MKSNEFLCGEGDVRYEDLPLEIQHKILIHLPYKTILNYCITSHTNRKLIEDNVFWKRKIIRDFGGGVGSGSLYKYIPEIVDNGVKLYSEYLYAATYRLEYLAETGQFSLLEKYIDLGANINPRPDYSPLLAFLKSTSSSYKQFSIMNRLSISPEDMRDRVRWFLDCGSDPNVSDEYCRTPLMICEDIPTAKLLLKYGANPRTKDKRGKPVISRTSDVSLMKVLLEGRADPNDQDYRGFTALWDAISDLDENRVRLLLEYGARLDIKSNYGDSPLGLIKQMQNRLYTPTDSWFKNLAVGLCIKT